MILDVFTGDRFMLFLDTLAGEFEATVEGDDKPITLRDVIDDKTIEMERIDFALGQSLGDIIRMTRDGMELALTDTMDLLGFHKPEGAKVTLRELKDWETLNKKIVRAATKVFYIRRFKKATKRPGTGYLSMKSWINTQYPDALKEGLGDWKPTPSTVTRAYDKSPQASLLALISQTGKHKNRKKWPKWVYELGYKMARRYWTNADRRVIDAIEWFDGQYFDLCKENVNLGEEEVKPPSDGTLANWIHATRSHATVALKYGTRTAHRQLGGRGQSIVALRPLEWVVVDHTEAPIWLRIYSDLVDEDGNRRVLAIKRPWFVTALDLYSRLSLASFLSFDPPSTGTVMECLKRVITPKKDLIDRFGDAKGATDGFGFMTGIILDNALENIMVSMQMALEALGIDVEYSPKKTPEHKAWIERYMNTVCEMFRNLPGGIPLEISDHDPDPRDFATLTLEDASRLLDHRVVTRYHLNVHDGIGMPPALKFSIGLKEFNRPTVDDARTMYALMGRYKKASLTGEGVRIDGQTFSDPDMVSLLMDHCARLSRGARRRGKDQTFTFDVHTFRNPADCSHIYVVDLFTRQAIRLPNKDAVLAEGKVSWAWAKAAKKKQGELLEDFHSREERAAYNRDFQIELEDILAEQNHRDGKVTARLVEGGRNAIKDDSQPDQDIPENLIIEIEQTETRASISGMKGGSIKRDAAFAHRDETWEPPPGRRSGKGRPKSKQGTTTKTIDGVSTRIVPPRQLPPKPIIDLESSEARLDQLERLSRIEMENRDDC